MSLRKLSSELGEPRNRAIIRRLIKSATIAIRRSDPPTTTVKPNA